MPAAGGEAKPPPVLFIFPGQGSQSLLPGGNNAPRRGALPGLIRYAPAISPGTRDGKRRGSAAAFSNLMDERSPGLFKPRHALARSPRAPG